MHFTKCDLLGCFVGQQNPSGVNVSGMAWGAKQQATGDEQTNERKKEEAKLTLRRLQWRGASGGVYLGIRHGVGCGSDDGHGGAGVCEITMGRRHRGARVYSIGEGVGWGYGSVLIWAARRRVAHARDRHHACTFTACVQRHCLTFSLLSSTSFGGNLT